MNALKNLIELNDINQQYKIIDIMLKGLFKVSVEWAQCRGAGMGLGHLYSDAGEGRQQK